MSKKSLSSILKLQWWLHTSLTSLFFILVTFFFLFSMEDYFHENQLIDISNIVAVNPAVKNLPNHIKIYKVAEVPQTWDTQLAQVALKEAIEIDNSKGDAIHILRSKFNDSEETFVLALDTSKTHSIWAISDKLLILILPWIIIFLALATFLAKRFITQLQNHFKRLITIIKESESPDALDQFSESQFIDELAQFAQLFAEVWQQKVEILTREKQGLEYLSHELRTPIQSSLATLELLALKTEDKKTIDRLMRSLNRMTRLSNAILYLMESEKLLTTYPVAIVDICRQLVDELRPLAEVKKQSISINTEKNLTERTAVQILATQEVIETLLSIVLTNALQHSNSSPIIITVNHKLISIENEIKAGLLSNIKPNGMSSPHENSQKSHQGFGIGLLIAQRLANKFNLRLTILFNNKKRVTVTISNK